MSKRALLFYPPQHCHRNFFSTWNFEKFHHFPIGLLKFSTYLKSQGYRVDFLDAFNNPSYYLDTPEQCFSEKTPVRQAPYGNFTEEQRLAPIYHIGLSYEEVKKQLKALSGVPDKVYVSSLFTWSWQTTNRSISILKEVFPGAEVILGGIYPTLCPEKARESGADTIVEGPVPEVQHCWLDKELVKDIPGIAYIPFKTSLGCPNNCSYCAVDVLEGRRLCCRDYADISSEIISFQREMNSSSFHFWDSNILVKPERHLFKILELVLREKREFSFSVPGGFQPTLLTKETARALRHYRCERIWLSLETTDEKRMKDTGRPVTLIHLENALENLQSAGFPRDSIYITLLIGQPGQTLDSILKDIITCCRYGVKISLLVYTPIPRTADYTTYGPLFAGRELEDLDPLLYPFASPLLTTHHLDAVIGFFNYSSFPLESIARSKTDHPVFARMREMILSGEV